MTRLLRFSYYQFELGGRFYALLPKLTQSQVSIIDNRLSALGFKSSNTDLLRAAKGVATLTVDPRGLCWSNRDMADVIIPTIPELLSVRKEFASLRRMGQAYFEAKKQGKGFLLRLAPRMESSSLWQGLRAAGSCALTPDEDAVYSLLLSSSSLASPLPTDFPTEGSTVIRIGRKQYYSTRIDASEAASTLRDVEARGPRNTYLPRSSFLSLSSFRIPRRALRRTFEGLGEWCFFTPRAVPRKL
jgi:hypothetical protein